ncbi:hypothetical protein WME94_20930 [Sorangium sp. So ce429]
MTLYLGHAEDEGPEASESFGEAIWFDRRDPRSIRRAQEIIQDRLRLSVAPTLCDEPSPGLGAALRWILAFVRLRLRAFAPSRLRALAPLR